MVLKKRSSSTVEEKASKKRRKETTEVEAYESKKSKKSKAVVSKQGPLSEEEDEDEEMVEEDETKIVSSMWPEADLTELFNRIEAALPKDDNLSFGTRTEHLDWEEIAFNKHTPEECKKAWLDVLPRVRKFRIMREVLVDARQWVRKPWTSFYAGSKQNQHPDQPKRPLTQYMLYYLDKKDKVQAMNPHLDMTKLSKLVATMYKELPPAKTEKYRLKALALRRKYVEDMKKFYEEHPELVESKESKSKAAALPFGLKKPRTPLQMFIDDRVTKQRTDPKFNKSEVTDKAKLQWKTLSDKKKAVWINWAVEEENKYLEAIKLHLAENPDLEPIPYRTVIKKEEMAIRDRAAGKPVKPVNSAYSLYSSLMLANDRKVKELMPKDRMKEIARLWLLMPDEEKEEYAKKVKYQQERYKLDYATYLESLPEEERQEELMKTQTKKKNKVPDAVDTNNGKDANNVKPKISTVKSDGKKVARLYFPGEPHQPPVNSYELFVESFVADTKLSASEAPRFWEMLPASDKNKFQRKLKELKDKYIRDYKKFLKSLDEDEVQKYNDLQKRNKEREAAAAEAFKSQDGDNEEDEKSDDDEDSSDDEDNVPTNSAGKEDDDDDNDDDDSDSDENEAKKSGSSSDSSSSSSGSSSGSSSSEDSDSSSDESDEDKKTNKNSASIKKEVTDSDSSDDE